MSKKKKTLMEAINAVREAGGVDFDFGPDYPSELKLTGKVFNGVEVLGEWIDSLICCPSQCYLDVMFNGVRHQVYLRWRWSDPWELSVITNGEFHDLHPFNWGGGGSPKNLDKIKESALKKAVKHLTSNP